MNIGILGSGVVGKQLGLGFARLGHKVKVGTRDTSKLKDWLEQAGKNASIGSFKAAAESGEIVFLCTLWTGTLDAIELAGKENFKGKIVVDVTNPLDFSKGMPPGIAVQYPESAGEIVQRTLPDSKVVKAFNIINANTMINPNLEEGDPDLFIAGNDDNAKKKISELAASLGWKSIIDIGDIKKSYWLETLTMLWVNYGVKYGSWSHAFKLLKK